MKRTNPSWHSITVKQYMELQSLTDNKDPNADLIEHSAKIMELLLKEHTVDEYLAMPSTDFFKEISRIDFIKTDIPTVPVKHSYKINGNTYTTVANPGELSVNQVLDFRAIQSNPGDLDSKLPALLSVFFVPKGSTYGDDSYSIEEVEKDCQSLPITDALSLFSFFLRAWDYFIEVILGYLKQNKIEKMKGMDEYLTSLEKLLKMIKQQK